MSELLKFKHNLHRIDSYRGWQAELDRSMHCYVLEDVINIGERIVKYLYKLCRMVPVGTSVGYGNFMTLGYTLMHFEIIQVYIRVNYGFARMFKVDDMDSLCRYLNNHTAVRSYAQRLKAKDVT